jgi:hypothetical protein
MLGAAGGRAAASSVEAPMWLLGGVPILVLVLGAGIVAFGAAVSWIAFRTRGAFALATGLSSATLAIGIAAWWRGLEEHRPLAPVPFQIAAGVTIGAGLVIVLGEMARGRRPPDDDDHWPPT